MSGELKEFPLSDLKRERLRGQGIVPFSKSMMHFAFVLGLVLGLLLIASAYGKNFLSLAQEGFSYAGIVNSGDLAATEREYVSEDLAASMEALIAGVFFVVLPIVVVLLLVGALQTKFFISFSLLGVDFGRLLRFSGSFLGAIFGHGRSGLCLALVSSCWLVLVGVLLVSLIVNNDFRVGLAGVDIFSDFPKAASGDRAINLMLLVDNRLEQFLGKMYHLVFAALGFSLFVGLLSYLYEVFRFRRDHRMTRAEVEDENREVETSPESKRAREDFGRSQ